MIKVLIKVVCLLITIAYYTIAERKIMAAIQRRRGPNVVGFWGLLQPLADGLKLLAKELVIPSHANSRIFIMAPLAVLMLSLVSWSVIPFGCFDYSEQLSANDIRDALHGDYRAMLEEIVVYAVATAIGVPIYYWYLTTDSLPSIFGWVWPQYPEETIDRIIKESIPEKLVAKYEELEPEMVILVYDTGRLAAFEFEEGPAVSSVVSIFQEAPLVITVLGVLFLYSSYNSAKWIIKFFAACLVLVYLFYANLDPVLIPTDIIDYSASANVPPEVELACKATFWTFLYVYLSKLGPHLPLLHWFYPYPPKAVAVLTIGQSLDVVKLETTGKVPVGMIVRIRGGETRLYGDCSAAFPHDYSASLMLDYLPFVVMVGLVIAGYILFAEKPKSLVTLGFLPAQNDVYSAVSMLQEINDIADARYGILIILAISGLSVYWISLAGWSSNSKYAFLGSLRSAAQMIAYEVAVSLTILPVVAMAGSANFTEIVLMQEGTVWFGLPLLPISILFFISMVAETNRTPFDLPEAEAELVAGYNVEYSSITFAMFFLAEYGNMILASLLFALLFLGGWLIISLTLKGLVFCFLFVLIRATLPRYRYDQLMSIGWKVFLPLATAYFVLVTGLLFAFDAAPFLEEIISL